MNENNEEIPEHLAYHPPKQEGDFWKCKPCGYVREGKPNPEYICPRCKLPASAFERME